MGPIITREDLLSFIKKQMEERELSISALEKLAGVSKDSIRDFQRGKTYILRADKYQKIMAVLAPDSKIF